MPKTSKFSEILPIIFLISLLVLALTEDLFYIWLILLFGGVILLSYLTSKFPNAKWAWIIWSSPGPRTDIQNMTKKEILRSGFQFLIGAIFFFAILLVIGNAISNNQNPIGLLLASMFLTVMLCLISIASCIYLFIRGIFKKENR